MTKNAYIETYGCQMNVSDSEIVASVLKNDGYEFVDNASDADVVLINTCSVRDNAERKIYEKLTHLKQYKKKNPDLVVGILGCMAENKRNGLFEKDIVDIIVGPDEYRKIPSLLNLAFEDERGIAIKLSTKETYDDIIPLRKDGISAWVTVMRGCDKNCSYCVVPHTRGKERSRSQDSIINELKLLFEQGFKEVTLLGQNVNSYIAPETNEDFADLLANCSNAVPKMRIRFVTSHPRDMSDKLIETIAGHENICKYIHLPIQSGSDRILELMNRNYTYEHYLGRMNKIKELMPNCSLSTDIIAGYPSETEYDHEATLKAIKEVKYEGAYMFKYSPRPYTRAFKEIDDVTDEIKLRRLNEIIELQQSISKELNLNEIGNTHEVLVESPSKRENSKWQGRTDSNKVVIFENTNNYKSGDFVNVKIENSTSATLFGNVI